MTQWWNVPKNVIFLLSQFHKYTLLTTNTADLLCFIQFWHRWCCKWIKDLWTSNSVYIDIHPTQYHYNQQALELPHKCAHISSIVSLEISMPLFLHSCWLIVKIIPCDSVVFFLPLLWLSAQHMTCLLKSWCNHSCSSECLCWYISAASQSSESSESS